MLVKIFGDGPIRNKKAIVVCETCNKEREIGAIAAMDYHKQNPTHMCRACATTKSQTGKKRTEESKKTMREAQRKCHNGGVRYNQGKGYRQLIVDDYHPRKKDRKGGNYIFEHILVMEKNIGRFLEKHEIVHHIDKDKQNNNIDNLYLFTGKNNKESSRMHNAAHESAEQIAIDLYKVGLVYFADGKYQMSTFLEETLRRYQEVLDSEDIL